MKIPFVIRKPETVRGLFLEASDDLARLFRQWFL
jgi:hypothetical protein